MGNGQTRRPALRTLALLGIAAELVLFALLTRWLFPNVYAVTDAIVDHDQSAGPEVGVTLAEVADHPEPMWGRTVTVSARVDTIAGSRAMLIGSDAPVVGDKVLVVSDRRLVTLLAEPSGARLAEGDVARVTGEVRRFEADALAAELGIAVDAPAVAGYDGEAVIVAEAIALNPPVGTGAGDPEFGGSAGPENGVTIDDVNDHPERYYGRTVTVSGEVEHVYGPHAAKLRDEGVLVVRREAEPAWFDESSAFVTGEVRPFDPEAIEAELGIGLGDGGLRAWVGRPVIVAQEVEIVK